MQLHASPFPPRPNVSIRPCSPPAPRITCEFACELNVATHLTLGTAPYTGLWSLFSGGDKPTHRHRTYVRTVTLHTICTLS
jgi:hypothetical protein